MTSKVSARPGIHKWHRNVATLVVTCGWTAFLSACKSSAIESTTISRKSLDTETIASVGKRSLTRNQFENSTVGKSLDAESFVNGWLADALIAEAAEKHLLESTRTQQVERSVLARALLERFHNRAVADGIPTDAEIERLTAERWFEIDRPVAAKTTHFVVRTDRGALPAAAHKLARKIAGSVRGIVDPAAFVAAVKAASSDGIEVLAESLPPVTAEGRSLQLDKDGKTVGAGPHFVTVFARAANAIEAEGGQSGLIQTAFGVHVILLEHRIPAHQVPIEDRRRALALEVYSRRARVLSERCIEEGKKRRRVQIEPSFHEIVAALQVAP
jgi:peptidyl-prolyl cis-trans isomerase C